MTNSEQFEYPDNETFERVVAEVVERYAGVLYLLAQENSPETNGLETDEDDD